MKKLIIARTLQAAFLGVLYAAFVENQQWAYNLIIPIAVITITLAFLSVLLLNNDEFKQKIKLTRKPRTQFWKWYSFSYCALVTLILCAFGYAVTGVLWFFIMTIVWSVTSDLDEEIKNGETK
jgi:magnesium-transporting ATPase (P-type)